jgi:hypothetical protein
MGVNRPKFTSLFDPWRIEDFEHPNLAIVSLRGCLVPRGLDFWIVGSAKFPVGDNSVSQDLTYGGDAIAYNDREVTLNCCRYFWLNVNVCCPEG